MQCEGIMYCHVAQLNNCILCLSFIFFSYNFWFPVWFVHCWWVAGRCFIHQAVGCNPSTSLLRSMNEEPVVYFWVALILQPSIWNLAPPFDHIEPMTLAFTVTLYRQLRDYWKCVTNWKGNTGWIANWEFFSGRERTDLSSAW